MRVVVLQDGAERDVDVRSSDTTRIGELAAALFGPCGDATELFVDQQPVSFDTPLIESGLRTGSRLQLTPPDMPPPAAARLDVLSGPGAGASLAVPAGRHLLGSGEDVTIRYRAAAVRPQHMAIGVDLGGAVAVGAAAEGPVRPVGPATLIDVAGSLFHMSSASAAPPPLCAMPGRRGTVPFNRPPRVRRRPDGFVVRLPAALAAPSSTSRMSIVSLVVPIVFGLTLAILIHPRMALFALLGPVMMIGGALEDRRRKRKHRRDSARKDAEDRGRVLAQLDGAVALEVVQRHRRHPSLPELARRSEGRTRMWERRPDHDDFMQLAIGYGQAAWRPVTEGDGHASAAVRKVVAARTRLPRVPVAVDLGAGAVIGLAGTRQATTELARALVAQAAVLHGPADLRIAVVTDHPEEWRWASWLPHTSSGVAERRLLAVTPEDYERLVTMLTPPPRRDGAASWSAPIAGDRAWPLTLLVIDGAPLAAAEGVGLRTLLGGGAGPVAGIVLALRREALPSVCTTVVQMHGHRGVVHDSDREAIEIQAAGATPDVATQLARNLSGFADPEQRQAGAELPDQVRLVELMANGLPTPDDLLERWRLGGSDPCLAGPIGVTEAGPLVLDVVRDGPHGLLAGTTGAGKSELLRTLVASLAAAVDPDHLTFVLVDYKGGSAFDACADLPHTVGIVTDLDEALAARALQCLEAELCYRERRLRTAEAEDIAAFLATAPAEPLPRMLIVIDEFAALAKELPDLMDALVDIAARGRSLGVHLLLATQRPAGVIRDNVRANTNIRIALRVQDRSDSSDVIGDTCAAAIPRSQPGRGLVRLGPGELVPFQAAMVSGPGGGRRVAAIALREVGFAMEPLPYAETEPDVAGRTDLEDIVAAAAAAARQGGYRPPRRPWPEPLPATLFAAEMDTGDPPTATAVPVGLVDEPDLQRQRTMWWDPDQGSLALYGIAGAGTTTALGAIAVSLAHRYAPDALHMYVMDFDAGALSPLAELPHVGAVVTSAERERQVRLVRRLSRELERRKRGRTMDDDPQARVVVLIDNYAGFTAAFEATPDAPMREAMGRVMTEGAGVGIVAVATGMRQNAIPLPIAATIGAKLVFRMADPLAAATFGLRRIPPDLPPGRAIHVGSNRAIQMALPHADGLGAAVSCVAQDTAKHDVAQPIEELPMVVQAAEVAPFLRILDEEWWIPVGLGDTDLTPVGLPLGAGDHALIAGEPRSGRSTLLRAIGDVVALRRPDIGITAVALRPSPLRELGAANVVSIAEHIDAALARLGEGGTPQLVLIDDADAIEATPALREVVATQRPDVHVVAAARRDLKTQYNHWARDLCRSRVGLWLKPGPGLDGDLWSTPMPRHLPAGLPPGRGLLVAHGTVELVQAIRD